MLKQLMRLIIGLGNPGEKYKNNRHNVGFTVVEKLAEMINSQWSMVKKFDSLIIKHQPSFIMAKPQTFMNSSGIAVSSLVLFYKIQIRNLIVIHDDLDIKLGEYKIQFNIGPKLHYGISSIEEMLGSKDFLRVRVGIDNRKTKKDRISGEKYVLQDFEERELVIIEKISDNIVDILFNKYIKVNGNKGKFS